MFVRPLTAPVRPDAFLSGDARIDASWSMLANLKSPMHPDQDLDDDGAPDYETYPTGSGRRILLPHRGVSRSTATSTPTAFDDEMDFALSFTTQESEAGCSDVDAVLGEEMVEVEGGGLPEEPLMRKINATSSFRMHAVRARRERIRAARHQVIVDFLQRNNFGGVNAPRSRLGLRLLSESVYPLHVAAQRGDAHMVQELLREKADPEKRSSSGRTAVDMAHAANHFGSHCMVLEILSGRWNSMSFRDLRAMSCSDT
ncbi:unnamed protein product [Symbiodinium sp. CCMP2456]|nr:unnamed protein product [Symbiodinium sp. CCMP2456]